MKTCAWCGLLIQPDDAWQMQLAEGTDDLADATYTHLACGALVVPRPQVRMSHPGKQTNEGTTT